MKKYRHIGCINIFEKEYKLIEFSQHTKFWNWNLLNLSHVRKDYILRKMLNKLTWAFDHNPQNIQILECISTKEKIYYNGTIKQLNEDDILFMMI